MPISEGQWFNEERLTTPPLYSSCLWMGIRVDCSEENFPKSFLTKSRMALKILTGLGSSSMNEEINKKYFAFYKRWSWGIFPSVEHWSNWFWKIFLWMIHPNGYDRQFISVQCCRLVMHNWQSWLCCYIIIMMMMLMMSPVRVTGL